MSNIFKKIFSNKTKKNRSSPGIEMQEIPYLKRLGKRTSSKKTTSSKKRTTTSIIPRSPPSRRICRGKKKEVCINFCKFTKGPLRKYCRKSKNDRIQF